MIARTHLLYIVVVLLPSCWSFQSSAAAGPKSSSTRLSLQPPKSTQDLMQKDGATSNLYDDCVQKTYGYVRIVYVLHLGDLEHF